MLVSGNASTGANSKAFRDQTEKVKSTAGLERARRAVGTEVVAACCQAGPREACRASLPICQRSQTPGLCSKASGNQFTFSEMQEGSRCTQASALPTGLHPLGSSFEDEASEPEASAGLPYAAARELSAQEHLHGDQEPGEPPGLITEAHSAPSTPGLMSMLLSCPHHHTMWPFPPRASMAVWPHGCTQTHRQQALRLLREPKRVLCSEQALGHLPTSGTRQTL